MKIRMLVVVKAYPVIDQESMNEAVCVAGLSVDERPPRWIRLFPLDFRGLNVARRFEKYDIIELNAKPSRKDNRPESLTPDLESIRVVDSVPIRNGSWRNRLDHLESAEVPSMCDLIKRQRLDHTSLGTFRPLKVLGLDVERQSATFSASQLGVLSQPSLLGDRIGDSDRVPLRPLPLKFKYRYLCGAADCGTHRQTIVDWELGALFMKLQKNGEPLVEIESKIRSKYLDEFAGSDRDLRLVVGTMKRYANFIVIGVTSPVAAKQEQSERLF
ncbi:MAG TPA: hypothetical protein VMF31_05700 [Solirubrobacterales bacterium]|nr:hypothetical protein [Solirubrobacterales bacterium]